MKKIIYLPILFLVICLLIVLINKKENNFFLENTYYGESELIDINIKKLNELISEKKSFAVLVYQDMCVASSDFNKIVQTFQTEKEITFYKIPFSKLKESDLNKTIKYYPSFMIYKKGVLIDYLKADKNDNIKYYQTVEGFESWFLNYVILK
ncbi:MAG: hypothetical protein PHF21_02180 [Bacilli bacterium]|nr:hypothetical protein [Bacilli bacterium]